MSYGWTKICPVCKGLMHEKNTFCSAACTKQAYGVNIDEPISKVLAIMAQREQTEEEA